MSAAELFEKAKTLPIEERAELLNQLSENLAQAGYDLDPELSAEQVAELERRAEEFRKNPDDGVSWEEIKADLSKRYDWK